MALQYIIYCDESEERGKHFSDFYGGVLIASHHIDEVRNRIAKAKADQNLFGEVKWTKITANYKDKYVRLLDEFFDLVAEGKIKVRIQFTKNTILPLNLTRRHIDEKYFILYYQFIKHAFGLAHAPSPGGASLRIYFDKMPDTAEQFSKFKSYIVALGSTSSFRRRGLSIHPEDVTEVASHDHDVLQCLDIILGAIHFRLNDKHLEIPAGQTRRGKRTVAKEQVYKHIGIRIRQIYPGFNIGVSTGTGGDGTMVWHHPYRHWLFVPRQRIVVPGGKRRGPK